MLSRFRWITFDVSGLLRRAGGGTVRELATDADFRDFPRTPVFSREAAYVCASRGGGSTPIRCGDGSPGFTSPTAASFLNWRARHGRNVVQARDPRYGLVLNVQRGTSMRFECHVDSNPLTGLLFCTDHAAGGELVFAHDPAAAVCAESSGTARSSGRTPGHLIFFDARQHPHYARPLTSRVGHANRRRHELLHRVLPGIDPADGS